MSPNKLGKLMTRALVADLKATLAKHGLELLQDDGAYVFLDDFSDTAKFHVRELGFADKWRNPGWDTGWTAAPTPAAPAPEPTHAPRKWCNCPNCS